MLQKEQASVQGPPQKRPSEEQAVPSAAARSAGHSSPASAAGPESGAGPESSAGPESIPEPASLTVCEPPQAAREKTRGTRTAEAREFNAKREVMGGG
jgi:hypothetical protein